MQEQQEQQQHEERTRRANQTISFLALICVIVALTTPWVTLEGDVVKEFEESCTLWSCTFTETGQVRETLVRHSGICMKKNILSNEQDDNCDRLLSSKWLVISALVLSAVSFVYEADKPKLNYVPILLLVLSAILMLSAWVQWPGITPTSFNISAKFPSNTQVNYDGISFSTGFAFAIVANILLIGAAIITPDEGEEDDETLPQVVYAETK